MSLVTPSRRISLGLGLVAAFWMALAPISVAAVENEYADFYQSSDIMWFNPTLDIHGGPQVCSLSGPTGTDHDGNQVLPQAQLDLIKQNQSTYEQAARSEDVPWQLLAVIHLRETGLKRSNPSNGQGIYQFLNRNGGPYPTGEVDNAEFLRQTKLAAKFLKSIASGNVDGNKKLNGSSGAAVIKDTLFSYNGRAGKYADQAASLGYDRETEPYEGSPYVMNRADKDRDPKYNQTTWGQVKRDHGPIEYPANNDYGAFVIYAALTGASADCRNSAGDVDGVRATVVSLAQQELELWNGSNKPSYTKYSHGGQGNWCAWFTSWIYSEAGYPLKTGGTGAVPTVQETKTIGQAGDRFNYYTRDSDYAPQVGDIVIKQRNSSHVHIVTAVEGTVITTIGGNQGYGQGGQATNFRNSIVSEYKYDWTTDATLSGFVSPKS